MTENTAQEASPRPQRQRAPAKWRIAMGVTLGIVLFVVGIAWIVTRENDVTGVSRAAPPPRNLAGSAVTDAPASAEYARRLAELNRANIAQAETAGKTYVGISGGTSERSKVDENLEQLVVHEKPKDAAPPAPSVAPVTLPPAPIERASATFGSKPGDADPYKAIYQQIGELEKRMDPGTHKVIAIKRNEALDRAASHETTAREAKENSPKSDSTKVKTIVAPIKPGDVLIGNNELELNSDSATPVVVTVITGTEDGGKFFGKFKRQDDWLLIEFDRFLASDGSMYRVKAYVVDSQTPSMSVRSEVDHRYLQRWGGLLASNFLNAYGNAVKAKGSVSIAGVGVGTTVTQNPNYSSSDLWKIAAGDTMKPLVDITRQQFSLPPRVKLFANETVGVLILEVGS